MPVSNPRYNLHGNVIKLMNNSWRKIVFITGRKQRDYRRSHSAITCDEVPVPMGMGSISMCCMKIPTPRDKKLDLDIKK